ncbi:zf-HC2 domain-containing protein [Marinobacter qingdaonensis]|uniref:Zf-HC2 domain-containing protein n=1 Tax=Marinobacter qingdaonensis TaxID=3108486 RepID=A0ABU5NW95_9GAMM|nr:zf-HC2 domain-containing protein [Marinobacter sp. ASW11-75]MEA1080075.1 zf-HC2 domain-containing protein [Marinobacter sp. ASW11-75]MEE2762912.1 zf-HC2 domain-containing protein [Pseudomonadota bacterium]MEE3118138.1 zf-HC2 domain-containing protein [Pseudomonadota bacterium]
MLMCRELAGIASDYIDGELNAGKNLSIKMHLMMCRHCRSFIGNLRASTELMRGHSSARVDDAVLDRINQRVTEALKSRRGGPPSDDPG